MVKTMQLLQGCDLKVRLIRYNVTELRVWLWDTEDLAMSNYEHLGLRNSDRER